jgi:hypothetical protein
MEGEEILTKIITDEDLEVLIEGLNTYRYAYLGLREQQHVAFTKQEYDHFDKITEILLKNGLKTRN